MIITNSYIIFSQTFIKLTIYILAVAYVMHNEINFPSNSFGNLLGMEKWHFIYFYFFLHFMSLFVYVCACGYKKKCEYLYSPFVAVKKYILCCCCCTTILVQILFWLAGQKRNYSNSMEFPFSQRACNIHTHTKHTVRLLKHKIDSYHQPNLSFTLSLSLSLSLPWLLNGSYYLWEAQ